MIKTCTLVNLLSALQDQDGRYSKSYLCRTKFLPNAEFFFKTIFLYQFLNNNTN